MHNLLTGGRPVAALGRDCCYRGVGSLTDDVDGLQKEKIALQNQLKECVTQQHEAMQRAMRLAEQNERLTAELHEMEKVALSVEAEANAKLMNKGKEQSKLEVWVDVSFVRLLV